MARKVSNVNILTDTWEILLLQTNEVLNSLSNEIITANASYGVTGNTSIPRNSQLVGAFGANNIVVTDHIRGGNVAGGFANLVAVTNVAITNTTASNIHLSVGNTTSLSYMNPVSVNLGNTEANAYLSTNTLVIQANSSANLNASFGSVVIQSNLTSNAYISASQFQIANSTKTTFQTALGFYSGNTAANSSLTDTTLNINTNTSVYALANSTNLKVASGVANLTGTATTIVLNGNATTNSTHTATRFDIVDGTSNTVLTSNRFSTGNTTANVSANSTVLEVANAQSNATVTPTAFKVGNTTAEMVITSNLISTSTPMRVANATTFANTLDVIGLSTLSGNMNTPTANASIAVNVGANVTVNTTSYKVGNVFSNSTVITDDVINIRDSDGGKSTQILSTRFRSQRSYVDGVNNRRDATELSNTELYIVLGEDPFNSNTFTSKIVANTSAVRIANSTVNTEIATGSVRVGSNVNLSLSTITVGNSTVNSAITATSVDLDGTLAVLNSVSFSNTLSVTGNTTLANTLSVTGNTTLANTLSVAGATSITNTLRVTGAANLTSTLGVTGAVALANTISVTGNATLSNTLSVTGLTTLSGGVNTTTANATSVNVGNSTVYTTITGTSIGGNPNAQFNITNSSIVDVTSSFLANSTQVVIRSTAGLNANGSVGTNGQVLKSNGTSVYWGSDNNTTYSLSSVANTGANEARIRLADSNNVNTDIIITGANGTIASSNSSQVTITSSIDTAANITFTGIHTHNANLVIGAGHALIANGYLGTAGQILASNGSSIYWTSPATYSSPTATDGLGGNTTHYYVIAGNGIIANTSGVHVRAGTGVTSNSTGVHIGQDVATTASPSFTGRMTLKFANTSLLGTPTIYSESAGNTTAVPTQSINNSTIFRVDTNAYTGSAYVGGPSIRAVTTENIESLKRGSRWEFYAIPTGGATAYGMTWDGSTLNLDGAAVATAAAAANLASNATYLTTGTIPYGRIPSNITNTTSSFTISGGWTFNANVALGANVNLILSSNSGIQANGSYGTAGHVLHSNGSAVYWAVDDNSGTVTSVATGNGLTGGPITTSGTLSVQSGSGIVSNSSGVHVATSNGILIDSGVAVRAGSGLTTNTTGVHVVAGSGVASNTSGVHVVAGSGVASNTSGVHVVAGSGVASNTSGVHVVAGSGVASNSSGVHVATSNGILIDSGVAVRAGSGLTTNTTGVHVVAGSGVASNTTGVHVVAGTGVTSNTTGVHVVAGTGVTSNSTGVHIGQAVSTSSSVTFANVVVQNNTSFGILSQTATGNSTVSNAAISFAANGSGTLAISTAIQGSSANSPNINITTGNANTPGDITIQTGNSAFGGPGGVLTLRSSTTTWATPGTNASSTFIYAGDHAGGNAGGLGTITAGDIKIQGGSLTHSQANSTARKAGSITIDAGNVVAIACTSTVTTYGDILIGTTNRVANLQIGNANTEKTIIYANGSIGTAGQILHSNGTASYWATLASSGTVTSVSSGNGLTGGPITTSGTLSVQAGTGVTSNSTGVHIGQDVANTASVTFNGVTTQTAKITAALRETKTTTSANQINLNNGSYFTHTTTGTTTFSVTNVPTTGNVVSFILDITNGGAYVITWWSGIKWVNGAPPALTSIGRDMLGFVTYDGGTTWTGLVLGYDVK